MSGNTHDTPLGGAARRIGKDHLNLADWRISVSTFQQPLKKDGGKLDFIEYVIRRADGTHQSVALEAPAQTGLPTAGDEDVLIGLLFLARQQGFDSDIVHFIPFQLLKVIGWPLNQQSFARLKKSLKRLKAVTVTYESAWYSRRTKGVEPTLMTGILAEAKLVLRKGRRPADAVADSYVQWTHHFYTSLQDGNLTDLDLELYFSWRRPGTKHLYRHLNKVWHAGRKPRPYERDLKELACGHLGMTDCKDLKRNFHALVQELDAKGYLAPADPGLRYRKVRPGVWRVSFQLHPDHTRPIRQPGEGTAARAASAASDAQSLVSLYHRHRFGRDRYQPRPHEIKQAEKLLGIHSYRSLEQLVPAVARTVQNKNADDLYFGFAAAYFSRAIEERQEQVRRRQHEEQRDARQSADWIGVSVQVDRRRQCQQELLAHWKASSVQQRARYRAAAIASASSEFIRRRIRRSSMDQPAAEVLAAMASELPLPSPSQP